MVCWLVVGSDRCGRGLDVGVARATSAADGHGHRRDGQAALRAGAGPRYRSGRSARPVAGGGSVQSRPPPRGRRGRAWPGWSSGTRSASGGPDGSPGRPGPCRSGSAPQSAKQNAPMNAAQVGQTPILGREGLLRLVEVVERLRARARGEEGESSWTTVEAAAPDPGPTVGDAGVLGGAAGGQPPGGGAVAGGAGQPGGGGTGAGGGRAGDRRLGPGL
jgi:hypothetical protein